MEFSKTLSFRENRVGRAMTSRTAGLLKLLAVTTGMVLTCGLFLAQEKAAGLLKPGAKIPGAFQTLSVTLPPTMLKPIPQAGRFHCPVCEYRLNPAVLIFGRQPDSAEALKGLLQKLDAVIGKHPELQVGAC